MYLHDIATPRCTSSLFLHHASWQGFADLVCPLCYVYSQPLELYFVFREMWIRYWCKLHSLSAAPGSLLPLLRRARLRTLNHLSLVIVCLV